MELRIKVMIAALILCGAMTGCGPSQADLKAQKLKAQKTAQAIAQAMGTEEQRRGWDSEDRNPWWNADQAIQALGYAECPRDLTLQGQHSSGFVPPFYPNPNWSGGHDEHGLEPSEVWMACYQPFFDAQHKLDAERQAKRVALVEAEKAKKEAQAKAEAEFKVANPEEDAVFIPSFKTIVAKSKACDDRAFDSMGHTPEEFAQLGGDEALDAKRQRCIDTFFAEEKTLTDKYPHAYKRYVDAELSGPRESNESACLHGAGANCSVNNERLNFATGCQYGYTTDRFNTITCNSKPVDVRIVP
jgi:hypothetical protein